MHYVIVDGVRLAYRLDGAEDAPALVLINSLGTDVFNAHLLRFLNGQ